MKPSELIGVRPDMIWAKDMKEGISYNFRVSVNKVMLKNGIYHYTTVTGEKFIGKPHEMAMCYPSDNRKELKK